jgi:elongation factor P
VPVPADVAGDSPNYLAEGSTAQVAMHRGVPIAVELPASVVLTISQTQGAVRGDTRTNVLKPATTQTGYVVQVPLFVETGERVKVDTRSGTYIERVK